MSDEQVPEKQKGHPSDALFRAALDASPHGVLLRSDGNKIYSNNACERLLSKIESGKTESGEPARPQVQTAQYEFTYEGTPIEATIALDVTERRRMESQLQEAQRLEALGRWVGGVVHDFNNLLTAVMLYSDLTANAVPPDSVAARYNEEIRTATRRGADLVGQLLAFGRQNKPEAVVMSLNSLLSGVKDVLQRMIGEDVELAFDLAKEPCNVRFDLAQMQQVIFNLALNSRDAMPEGGRLTFRTREDVEDGATFIALVIEDAGCGMDAQTLTRACEPFFTTKAKGKGTGLGLTMVKSMVAQGGGRFFIESEQGKGTRVTVRLPRAESSASDSYEMQIQFGAVSGGDERILLVEDDASVRGAMRTFLAECGYKVLEASNGAEAMQIAEHHGWGVDLVIADVILPGISGRQLARRLQAQREGLKVMFISGYGEYTPRSGECDVVEVFQKPFNRAALAARVREALGERGARADQAK